MDFPLSRLPHQGEVLLVVDIIEIPVTAGADQDQNLLLLLDRHLDQRDFAIGRDQGPEHLRLGQHAAHRQTLCPLQIPLN